MSTPERSLQSPTTTVDIEALLARSFAVDPPPAVAEAMDRRVAQAVETRPGSSTAVRSRPGRFRVGRRGVLRTGLLAAAVVVLVGAGSGLLALYESFGGGSYGVAWDRGARLGLREVVDGYRVTLERAYGDATGLMLAISVEDTEDRGWSQLGVWSATVVDDTGAAYDMRGGGSSPLDRSAAANVLWFAPPTTPLAAGTRHLRVTLPTIEVRDAATPPPATDTSWMPWHSVPGPWTFDFDLPVLAGIAATPGIVAESRGVTLTLESIVVAPAAVQAVLSTAGLPPDGRGWAPVGSVVGDGRTMPIASSSIVESPGDGRVRIETSGGADDAGGTWTVRIDELVGDQGGAPVRLTGPWVFSVSLSR